MWHIFVLTVDGWVYYCPTYAPSLLVKLLAETYGDGVEALGW